MAVPRVNKMQEIHTTYVYDLLPVAKVILLFTFCNCRRKGQKLRIEPTELANMQFVTVEEYQNWFPQFANVFYGDAAPLTSVTENIPSLA